MLVGVEVVGAPQPLTRVARYPTALASHVPRFPTGKFYNYQVLIKPKVPSDDIQKGEKKTSKERDRVKVYPFSHSLNNIKGTGRNAFVYEMVQIAMYSSNKGLII